MSVCVCTMAVGLFNQQYALCVLVGGNIICNRSCSNCPTGSQTREVYNYCSLHVTHDYNNVDALLMMFVQMNSNFLFFPNWSSWEPDYWNTNRVSEVSTDADPFSYSCVSKTLFGVQLMC